MKKFLFVLLFLITAFALFSQEIPHGLEYHANAHSITITRYTGRDETLVIPAEIEGLPVTSIASRAFKGNLVLTNVVMPDSIVSIGMEAFHSCTRLVNLTMSKGVTSIGERAFYNCSNLTGILIPDGVSKIEYETFFGCNSLTSVTFDGTINIATYLRNSLFPGNLAAVYTDRDGGIGTYTRAGGGQVWRKQEQAVVTAPVEIVAEPEFVYVPEPVIEPAHEPVYTPDEEIIPVAEAALEPEPVFAPVTDEPPHVVAYIPDPVEPDLIPVYDIPSVPQQTYSPAPVHAPVSSIPARELFYRGVEAYNSGNFDLAITEYTAVIQLSPENAAAYNNRGIAYIGEGNYDRAAADFETALRINPNLASAEANLTKLKQRQNTAFYNGKMAFNIGNYRLAINEYTTMIRLNPNSAAAYNNRGVAYIGIGEYDHAIADFEAALRINPYLASAEANLTRIRDRR